MSLPSPTVRNTPPIAPMKDGHRSMFTFANAATISVWEKGMKPMGMDGGDMIDVNTMHTGTWFQQWPRAIIRTTPLNVRVGYITSQYPIIRQQINVNQAITQWFPSSHWVTFYGVLRLFDPEEMVEGTQPEAQMVLEATHWDPVGNVEHGPAWGTSGVSGTGTV